MIKKAKKKINVLKIRVPVRIPPGQVFESKKRPISRARIRKKYKKDIIEGLDGNNK